MASTDESKSLSPAVAMLTLVGVGFVVWLVVGLVVGLVLGDVAAWVGRIVAVGMLITGAAGVVLILRAEQAKAREDA